MSTPSPCVPCCTTPQIVDIPGLDGAAGAAGTPGPNILSALTTTAFNGILVGNGAVVGAVANPLPIANGGTGAIAASTAAQALGTIYRLLGVLKNANFNITTDQAIAGFPAKWILRRIIVQNASVNMTTAAGGLYTGAGKTGTVLVAAAQVYTALTAAAKWLDLTIDVTVGGPTTDVLTATSIFFALTTAQGAPATADIYLFGEDIS